jgi:hypothetical protein
MTTRCRLILFSILGGMVGAFAVSLPYMVYAIYGLTDPDWDLDGGGIAIVAVTMFMFMIGVAATIVGSVAGAAGGLLVSWLIGRRLLAEANPQELGQHWRDADTERKIEQIMPVSNVGVVQKGEQPSILASSHQARPAQEPHADPLNHIEKKLP